MSATDEAFRLQVVLARIQGVLDARRDFPQGDQEVWFRHINEIMATVKVSA